MSENFSLVLYICMILASLLFEVIFKRIHFLLTRKHYKEHHFILGRYVMCLIFPLVVLSIIYYNLGSSILHTFVASAVLGTLFEYTVGWWFNRIMGTRLWTYNKYSINKYTSFLAIPLWGVLGVFLLLVVRLFMK